MSAFEKINRQREAEQLLCNKESIEYSTMLLPMIFNSKSEYRFELSVGSVHNDTIVSVVAYDNVANNSSITIYGFDKKDRKDKKLKLIKDMLDGKVKLEDFSDMRFY